MTNPMFDRYTDRARRALVISQDEARALGQCRIGQAHLLLGLIGEDGGAAAVALKSLGAGMDEARRVAARADGRLDDRPQGPLPFTPRAKAVLEGAFREAVMLGNAYIATEHLLLSLAANCAPGTSPLVAIGINPDDARARVLELLRGYEEAGKRPSAPGPAPQQERSAPDTVFPQQLTESQRFQVDEARDVLANWGLSQAGVTGRETVLADQVRALLAIVDQAFPGGA